MPHTLSRTDTAIAHEVLAAIIRQAEFAAHLVHQFLTSLGVAATPERPIPMPRWLLFDLGTALQIAWWEQRGALAQLPELFPPGPPAVSSAPGHRERPRAGHPA